MVLLLVTSCQAKGTTNVRPGTPPLDRLSAAITGVGTARSAVLNAVQAVERGASALDATDAVCATGRGVAARTSYRKGSETYAEAKVALRDLAGMVSNYRASLSALDRSRVAVKGAASAALVQVVRDGQTEATAVGEFEAAVTAAWPQYAALEGQEALWIKRAVTPWYRTDQEGSDAYAVLVTPFRHFLEVARTRFLNAEQALQTPTSVQAATLDAADRALATKTRS